MNYILVFLTSSLISFLGSMQLGPVNLAVIKTAVNRSHKAAVWVAVGGCLPEIVYSSLALAGAEIITGSKVFFVMEFMIIPVLLAIGIVNITSKPKEEIGLVIKRRNNFYSGFFLGMLNPQLLPFWLTVLIFFKSTSFVSLNQPVSKLLFVLGTAFGAFILLFFAGTLAHRSREKLLRFTRHNFNKTIGWIFILLALIQAVNFFYKFA